MTGTCTESFSEGYIYSIQVLENEVVNVRTKEKEGYWALQVGGVNHAKPKNVNTKAFLYLQIYSFSSLLSVQLLKPVRGQYERAGITPKRKLWEFRVTEDAVLPVGTPILAAHFVCGQHVDVCAKRCV